MKLTCGVVTLLLLVSAERDIVLEVSENVKREVIADVAEWVCSTKNCYLHSSCISF